MAELPQEITDRCKCFASMTASSEKDRLIFISERLGCLSDHRRMPAYPHDEICLPRSGINV
jgi:hypothetical protein